MDTILSTYIKPSNEEERDQYKKVILYLLDQPLEAGKLNILQMVLNEMDKLE